MSLINKMLQDLDARGTPGAESLPSQIRPVAPVRVGLADRVDARTVSLAAAGAAAVGAALALAWFGWGHYQKNAGAAKPAPVAAAPAQIRPAPELKTAQGMSSTITTSPVAAPVAEAPAPVKAAPVDERFDAPAAAKPNREPDKAAAPAPKSVAGYEPDSEEARAARQAIMAELQARMAPAASAHESKRGAKRRKLAEERELAAAKPAAKAGAVASAGAAEPVSLRAESEYRRALAFLQDGRMNECVAALEQALKLDPAHDAARQTLVGLLIEAKRPDEAIRHLQAGLALDPRQPALAMLLARLQIERGASGVDTLLRTLPYAGSNADYHAFLAGALQREQRNREAAEQYQAALRVAPGNGVWWMGLGMSLQAEKRNAEALEAFQRARASGTLSADLLAFVERRLQQLGR
jgi:MSHA biogenesis protein MshN